MSATTPRVKPFATLGVGEIPEMPVAFEENGSTPVAIEEGAAADDERAVMRTARYRVAVVVDRGTPTRERFEKDKGWRGRTGTTLPTVRQVFMAEHWSDEAGQQVKTRFFAGAEER